MKTCAATLLLTLVVGFHSKEKGSLVITLSQITKPGKVNVAVYSFGDTFPADKFMVKSLTCECKTATCSVRFDELTFGEYAVAIYQDVNSNGKLDTGAFGIPNEPFAFSNNFKPRWGGPTFEKCKFNFYKDQQNVEIALINSLF